VGQPVAPAAGAGKDGSSSQHPSMGGCHDGAAVPSLGEQKAGHQNIKSFQGIGGRMPLTRFGSLCQQAKAAGSSSAGTVGRRATAHGVLMVMTIRDQPGIVATSPIAARSIAASAEARRRVISGVASSGAASIRPSCTAASASDPADVVAMVSSMTAMRFKNGFGLAAGLGSRRRVRMAGLSLDQNLVRDQQVVELVFEGGKCGIIRRSWRPNVAQVLPGKVASAAGTLLTY